MQWLATCSLTGGWRLLRRLKLHYKRGRAHVHSPDPEYDVKLALIEAMRALVVAYPQRYVMLYEDEWTYRCCPTLACEYALAGSRFPVSPLGYSTNRKRRVAASLDILTGRLTAWQRASFRRPTMLAYFLALEAAYPDAELIFVMLDNWPLHFAPLVLEHLATTCLVLLPLPTYAPWTNPVEKVWRCLHQEVLHLHDFADDWVGLQASVQAWLARHTLGSLSLLHAVGLYLR